ncbi:MAG: filamentous hemagglutinin N-terminal domain-containing protein [Cyanobacteria bacterium P01_A01_bin.40]
MNNTIVFKTISPLFRLSLCTFGYLSATSEISFAQVTSDNTVNTQVTQNGNLAEITRGETRGSNLFHSFQGFSVPSNNEVYFNNANDISNIFSRVTGGNISNIDGLIRANGNANLFLINPAGIMFGEGARLDIGGSFYGSTATSILFENGEFSAVDLENPPLLTINAPIGLGFRDNPGDVNVQASNLRVPPGQNISIIGGEVNADNAIIAALDGTVNLAALSKAGTVIFKDNFGLDISDSSLANISLSNQTRINVDGAVGGDMLVYANNLTLANESIFNAGINSSDSNINTQAGNIIVNTSNTLALELGSLIRNNVSKNSFGNAGDIIITTQSLSISNNSRLSTISSGNGNTGNITVNAENITLKGNAEIKSQILANTVGKAGDISIDTNSLSLAENSLIFTNVSGQGDTGNINITARDLISLEKSSFLNQILANAIGNGGLINVKSKSLNLNRSSWLTDTKGKGNAGSIFIDIENKINLTNGSVLLTQVGTGAIGNAGNINIVTDYLISENSLIIADSSDLGNGGDINITADDTILLQGFPEALAEISAEVQQLPSQIITGLNENINESTNIVESAGQGNAGNINLSARKLIMKDLALVTSNIEENTLGTGGEININVDSISLENDAFISTFTESEFDAGSIKINAQTLELLSGGKLVTSTDGIGNAGTIELGIVDSIVIDNSIPSSIPKVVLEDAVINELQGRTGLFVNATDRATGNAGDIFVKTNSNLRTNQIILANNAEISADGGNEGNAGNILIETNSLSLDNNVSVMATTFFNTGGNVNLQVLEDITLNNDSLISAQAFNNANGGNVTIDGRFVIAFPNGNNDILASAQQGRGGNISINAQSLFGIQQRFPSNSTNDINASSEISGLEGTVEISTPDINPIQGATELPSNVIAPQQTTVQACQTNREIASKNGLTIKGKGGAPPAPELPLNSQNISINGEYIGNTAAISQPFETSKGKIQPARGISVSKDGKVTLTAYRTNNAGERIPETKLNC